MIKLLYFLKQISTQTQMFFCCYRKGRNILSSKLNGWLKYKIYLRNSKKLDINNFVKV